MGTEKSFEQRGFTDTAGWFGFGSAESGRTLLPAACKASEEPPKPSIRPDLFNCVELVAQFIMRPRFMDEILT
jgi:hypothetical protein